MLTSRCGTALGWREAARICVTPFAVGKALTVAVIVLGTWQHGSGTGRPGIDELRSAFGQWDGQNYLAIASSGYPADADPTPGAPGHLWASFPGYPLAIHVVGTILGDLTLGAVVLSAAAELVALTFIVRLVALERDRHAARFAAWLVALAPYALFFTVAYTESAFLAAAAASLFRMRRGSFVPACIYAMLATGVRITGLALIPALLLDQALRHRRRLRPQLAAILLVPLPPALFCAYAYLHAGDALAYVHIVRSASFNRALTWPFAGARATIDVGTSSGSEGKTFIFAVEAAFGIASGVGCGALWIWRRVAGGAGVVMPLAVYATAVWLLSTSQPYWLGQGRFALAMVPLVFIAVDVARDRPEWKASMLAASTGWMVFITTLWSQGAFVG